MKKQPETCATGLVIGIEAATAVGGIALVSVGGELVGEISLRSRESHAERLLPALEWLLATLGHSLHDCMAVAVSQGPGSFTGLRAGVATAKGLAFSLGVPLYGIPTLAALAANAPPGAGTVCAVINARRGEVFRAFFRRDTAGPERLAPDGLVPLQSLAAELPDGCLVVGDIASDLIERLPSGRSVRFAPPHLGHARAAVTAALGGIALGASAPSQLTTLMPQYLRPCDAVPGRAVGQPCALP